MRRLLSLSMIGKPPALLLAAVILCTGICTYHGGKLMQSMIIIAGGCVVKREWWVNWRGGKAGMVGKLAP